LSRNSQFAPLFCCSDTFTCQKACGRLTVLSNSTFGVNSTLASDAKLSTDKIFFPNEFHLIITV
jgi:hypothetical protein